MSSVTVNYNLGDTVNNTITSPATLTVTEADLYVVTDLKYLQHSQLTVYGSVTLGGVTSGTFKYYMTFDGTTWYPISLYSTSTGQITQRNVVVDSGTYSKSNVSYFADNVPLGACKGFKVTGLSSSGTPAYSLTVLGRDN